MRQVTKEEFKELYVKLGVQRKNVMLVDNRYGFFCGGFDCLADHTHFERNTVTGFNVGGDAGGTVTNSTFVKNAVGAAVGFIFSLRIDRSAFLKNDIGVLANGAQVTVSRSLFVKNWTAVRVVAPEGDDYACARLQRDRFIRNGVNLDGPRCAV